MKSIFSLSTKGPLRALTLILFIIFSSGVLRAATKTSAGTGNWGTSGTWSPSGVPASTDKVVINSGHTVTVNGNYTCANLEIGSESNLNTTLKITTSGKSLTINGDLSINPNNKFSTYTLDAGPGTISVAGTFSTWSTSGTNSITIGSGSITFTPAVTISSANQNITFTSGGTVNFNSAFTDQYNKLNTFVGCTVNFADAYTVNTTSANWSGKGTAVFTGSACSITPTSGITFNDFQVAASKSVTLNNGAGTVVIGGTITLASGSAFTSGKNFELDGDWLNYGGTFSGGSTTVTLNGVSRIIEGTASTSFPTLQVGKTGGSNAVSYTMHHSSTCTYLIINGAGYNRTLHFGLDDTLWISNNATINQPTSNSITSTLLIDSGCCRVAGNLIFSGNSNTISRVAKLAIASGCFDLSGSVTWMANTAVATELITLNNGRIFLDNSLTMGQGSGTLLVTGAGTINFNGATAPSFTFGGAATSPVFTIVADCTLKFANGFRNNNNALTLPSMSNSIFTGSGTVTPSAAISFGNLQINSGATLTLAGDISVAGNWTDSGTLAPGTGNVTINGTANQNISRPGGETFYKFTAANAVAGIAILNDLTVTNTFTLNCFEFEMEGNTFTLGSGSAASLVRTTGAVEGGTWKRWFPASAITSNSGAYYGLFPLGDEDGYEPIYINSTSAPTTAGYLIVDYTHSTSRTFVSYTDNEGDAIEAIADIKYALSTSALAGGTYNLDITFNPLGPVGVITDFKLETYTGNAMGSVGTHATTTGTVSCPTVKRTGLSATELSNVWVIGTKHTFVTPILTNYYSRKSGNWNDVTPGNGTWSYSDGGSGPSCDCVPTTDGYVEIYPQHPVNLNVSSTVDYLVLYDGGSINDNGASTLTVNKDLIAEGSGSITATGNWTVNRDLILASGTVLSSAGNMTVTRITTIPEGATVTEGAGTMTLSHDLSLSGTLNINAGALVLNGVGAEISGSGTVTATSGGTVTISGSKTILNGSGITFGSNVAPTNVAISGVSTITNYGTVAIHGKLTGNNAASTWTNAANSTLEITDSLLSTGTLNASASPNTVKYNGSGAQTIKNPALNYYNLIIANSGTKTLIGSATLTNELTIQESAILDEGINFLSGNASLTMSGTCELKLQRKASGTYPELAGLYSLSGGTVTISQTVDTCNLRAADYYNLKFSGTRPYNLASINNINNNFEVLSSSILLNAGGLRVGNNFTYGSSAGSTLTGSLTAGAVILSAGTFNDGGNAITVNGAGGWTRNGGTFTATGEVEMAGSAAQQIGGSLATAFNHLHISNAAGVTLNVSPAGATVVNNEFMLHNGLVYTDASNILKLMNNSISGSGSTLSYVEGPMVKVGNDDFTFPIGKSGRWRRVGIAGISDTATQVKAEYFAAPYVSLVPLNDSLTQVSNIEYWDVSRTVTTDPVKLKLFWEDASSSAIINCDYLTVAHWSGSQWIKESATVLAGSSCSGNGSGSIELDSYVTSFSPFSFGGSGGQALPVKLVSFNAVPKDKMVQTQWITEMEINNDYFLVERSSDGNNFYGIARVEGAGNSTTTRYYEINDENPLPGISYYRLRQTDFDGQFLYSNTVAVSFAEQSRFKLYPNPTDNELFLDVANPTEEIKIVIYNMLGQIMYTEIFPAEKNGGNNIITLQTKYLLPKGIYMVTASSNRTEFKEKVITL